MKVEDLIAELEKMPKDTDVCIFDMRKNFNTDDGDGSSEGIYSDISVELINPECNDIESYKETHGIEPKRWIAIHFRNEDYPDFAETIKEKY